MSSVPYDLIRRLIMPENTDTLQPGETPPQNGTEATGTPNGPAPTDMTTAEENLKNRNQVLEELLRQANGVLDGHASIFPGSHLHEDIHLAVTGQRL